RTLGDAARREPPVGPCEPAVVPGEPGFASVPAAGVGVVAEPAPDEPPLGGGGGASAAPPSAGGVVVVVAARPPLARNRPSATTKASLRASRDIWGRDSRQLDRLLRLYGALLAPDRLQPSGARRTP